MKGRVGFIGAGNITNALIAGLSNQNFGKENIFASSPEENHLEHLNNTFHINTTSKNVEVCKSCSVIILAIKPNIVTKVLKEISSYIHDKEHLIISVAAGVSISNIESILKTKQRIIRAMPNTPASIGMGVTALTNNSFILEGDKIIAEKIFNSVGDICWLHENSFNLYTSLIGSGPAYIFYLIEALLGASKGLNLETRESRELLTKMIIGSASLANTSQEEIKTLRERVTSPGGVTEKALEILDKNNTAEILIQAILEGEKKAFSLGKDKNNE